MTARPRLRLSGGQNKTGANELQGLSSRALDLSAELGVQQMNRLDVHSQIKFSNIQEKLFRVPTMASVFLSSTRSVCLHQCRGTSSLTSCALDTRITSGLQIGCPFVRARHLFYCSQNPPSSEPSP